MIYDCFTFFNELDLLEIRLNVLNDVVDKFVLVEMNKTHTGADKSFIFEENKERFAPFLDKIIYVKVDTYPDLINSKQDALGNKWILENYQRDQIMQGLKEAKDDDVVIISDLDELPNPTCIKNYDEGIKIFEQKNFYYFLNYLNISDPILRWGSKIGHFSDLKDPQITLPANERYGYSAYGMPTYFRCCMADNPKVQLIQNGGWHFSFVMSIEKMIYKRNSIVEQQFNTDENMSYEYIKKCVEQGKDLFGREYRYQALMLDSSFPKYILENQEKYKHMIFQMTVGDKVKLILQKMISKFFNFLYHKEKKDNGRRHIYVSGVKVGSYKKGHKMKFPGFSNIKRRKVESSANYKLGVSYSVWDGEELLEGAIRSIRPAVDYINVVWQKKSWFGELCNQNLENILLNLKKQGLIDEVLFFDCDTNISPAVNECHKRNMGLEAARLAGCTHFMTADADEYYNLEQFQRAKEYVYQYNLSHSACPHVRYFEPTLREVNPAKSFIPFIHKINHGEKFKLNCYEHYSPWRCDPTRQIPVTSKSRICFLHDLLCHHFCSVRKDLMKKCRNSSSSDSEERREKQIKLKVLSEQEKQKGLQSGIYVLVKNSFNIKID